ncbi:MAG: hypothetical protein AAGA77_03760 [Bacteroidota bacterium]
MIAELNKKLKDRFQSELEVAKQKASTLTNSPHEPIKEALELANNFDLKKFEQNVQSRLYNIYPNWIEIQSKEDLMYDTISLEYSNQQVPPYEVYSYGLRKTKDNPREYMYSGKWYAGPGFVLEPYSIYKPLHIEILSDEELYEELHENHDTEVYILENLASALCNVAFNKVFSEADTAELFVDLRINKGGQFMYCDEDFGGVYNPFYLKS